MDLEARQHTSWLLVPLMKGGLCIGKSYTNKQRGSLGTISEKSVFHAQTP